MITIFKKKYSIFRIASVIILIVCVLYCVFWFIENKKNSNIQKFLINKLNIEDIDTITNTQNNIRNINFDELIKINKDTVGWIKVNNTNIDYSLVKTNNNSFYLKHSFNKKFNSAGWIFVDYRNKFDGTDYNIIIYGHSRIDGSMFYCYK